MPIAFWTPGPFEMLVIGIVAILLFGRRLPEVARSLGRGLTEFKRGLRDEPSDANPPAAEANRIDTATPGPSAADDTPADDDEPSGPDVDEHPPA